MGLIKLRKEQQMLEAGANEVSKKIRMLNTDIEFLSGIIEEVETPVDKLNCLNCLSSIHKKIGDAMHLIQYYNIIISSASGISPDTVLNIGSLEITFPSSYKESDTRKIVNSSLEDLSQIVYKCNHLLATLLSLNNPNLIMDNDENSQNGSINRGNQSRTEFNDETTQILNETLTNIVIVSEDNEDSILILKSVISWDLEKVVEIAKSNSCVQFRWKRSNHSKEENNLNSDLKSNRSSSHLQNSLPKTNSSPTCTRRHLLKLRIPILLGLILSLIIIGLCVKFIS